MAYDNMTTPSAATVTLIERVKAILDEHKNSVAEANAEDLMESPDSDEEPISPATTARVIQCLSAINVYERNVYDLLGGWQGLNTFTLQSIMDEVMLELATNEYDPRPELTKEELTFLIGDRLDSTHCPFDLATAVRDKADMPLTFRQHVIADRHRSWLEKGADAKRKRLAKAQAEIAKLMGVAA